MERGRIGKKLLFPPAWAILLLSLFSASALVFVFANGLEERALSCVVYVIAFYTVSVLSVFLGRTLPTRYRALRQRVYDDPLGNRYMTDVEFKNQVSLASSLAINLLYAGVNVCSAWLYRTAWFGIFAGYYMILAVMRCLLVRQINRNRAGENRLMALRRARLCAGLLTTVSLVLPGAVLMILYQNRGFEYPGVLIYVMALYTFYMTASAIRDLIRYRKHQDPILSISKGIKLAAALVSMLALETAMFSQFGAEMAPEHQRLMIALTGAGVSAAVIAMAVCMIVRTTKEIRRQN